MDQLQLTLKAINCNRQGMKDTMEALKENLLVNVALHNWLRLGKPPAFNIRRFENWGRMEVTVTGDDEEGMRFMTIKRLEDEHIFPEVDINDKLFAMHEVYGG